MTYLSVQVGDREPTDHVLDDQGFLELEVSVPAGGMSWYVLR